MNKKIIGLIICMMLFLFIVLTIPTNLTEKETLIENIISNDNPELIFTNIISFGDSFVLNFSSKVKAISINITIQRNRIGELLNKNQLIPDEIINKFVNYNLYIYEFDHEKQNKETDYTFLKCGYEDIKGNLNIKIELEENKNYQIKFVNTGILPLISSTQILAISMNDLTLLLPTILSIGIIILTYISLSFLYKFRKLIYLEKRENNKILKKLIKNNKLDPNKVLEILREMNKSSNKEGLKLTNSLSSIANKIIDKLKSDQEDKNEINKDELIRLLKKSKTI